MFEIPAPTEFDVRFRLLGIPVRVHPFFWAMAAFLGWESHDGFTILVWIGCVFVSILVHEMGHGLTAERLYRTRSSVILYMMGGLCSYDGDERHYWRQAKVLAMGPGAGFLLFGLVLAVGLAVLGVGHVWPFGWFMVHLPPAWFMHLPEWQSRSVLLAYNDLLFINLFWGLFNLLPIYPLDGGRLAGVFLTMHDRREGPRRGFIVGTVTAGLVAIYFASDRQYYNAIFIASLAFLNFQLLQAAHAQRTSSSRFDEGDDWWRR